MARVIFFGRLRDLAGDAEKIIDAPTLSTLRAVMDRLHPALSEAVSHPSVSVAVDKVVRRDDAELNADSEVAFMPPLSGG